MPRDQSLSLWTYTLLIVGDKVSVSLYFIQNFLKKGRCTEVSLFPCVYKLYIAYDLDAMKPVWVSSPLHSGDGSLSLTLTQHYITALPANPWCIYVSSCGWPYDICKFHQNSSKVNSVHSWPSALPLSLYWWYLCIHSAGVVMLQEFL